MRSWRLDLQTYSVLLRGIMLLDTKVCSHNKRALAQDVDYDVLY